MIDLKLGALYAGTYSKGFVRTVRDRRARSRWSATLWVQVVFG